MAGIVQLKHLYGAARGLAYMAFAIVTVLVGLAAMPAQAAAFSGAGDGSSGDPYQITSCAQLQSIDDDPAAHYVLTQDIDCEGVAFTPISGNGSSFTGTLDGQRHRIENLHIEATSGFAGLFDRLRLTAVVKNLVLVATIASEAGHTGMLAGATFGDAEIENVATYGAVQCGGSSVQYCGGVVGFLTTRSSITKTYSEASVTSNGPNGGSGVGGLVGGAEGDSPTDQAVIMNTYFAGIVTATHDYVGGLAGKTVNTDMTKSYAIGSVTGVDFVGGLAGSFNGFMAEVFAANDITGTGSAVGPVTGHFAGGSVGNRYFDSAITGFSSSPDGSSAINDSTYFYDSATNPPFDTWDFPGVWRLNYKSYPSFEPLVDPYILCEAPAATDTTVTVHCKVAPGGWGRPTWEMRYRKAGAAAWTPLTQPDIRQALVTITGLTPGTDYEVSFRFTNTYGTSNWGRVEVTTTGTAPKATNILTVRSSQAAATASAEEPEPAGSTWQPVVVLPADTSTAPTTLADPWNNDIAPGDAPAPAKGESSDPPGAVLWITIALAGAGLAWLLYHAFAARRV